MSPRGVAFAPDMLHIKDGFVGKIVKHLIDGYFGVPDELSEILQKCRIELDHGAEANLKILKQARKTRPERAGICVDLVRSRPRVPLLGVCLGHQVLGAAFGAEIGRAPRLMHGKTSFIRHLDRGVFKSLSNPFEATRYHSLEVRQESLPEELEPLAWSDEETLMGMRHRQLPYQGVQFHPESILTIEGPQLMDNFLAECEGETRDSPREG